MSTAFSLLAQPARVEILRLVWSQERSAGDIASQFQTTFGAVSQHIGSLWRAGFLRRRRQGKQLFYVADHAAIGPVAIALEAMWRDQLGVLKQMAEAEQKRIDSKDTSRAAGTAKPRSATGTAKLRFASRQRDDAGKPRRMDKSKSVSSPRKSRRKS